MYLIINIHDVSPYYRADLENTISFLYHQGLRRFSLFVIPYLWSRFHLLKHLSFVSWLKKLEGCEFILHGYTHQNTTCSHPFNYLLTNKEGEFFMIGYQEAKKRLSLAKTIISKVGIETNSFAAPAWLIGNQEKMAVWDMGFEYLITLRGVYAIKEKKFIFLPAMSFTTRTPLRISLSRIFCTWPRLFRQKILRIDLHPWDIRHKWIQNKISSLHSYKNLTIKEALR